MPIFQYKAYVHGGGTTTGVIDADTAREARTPASTLPPGRSPDQFSCA